MAVDPQTLFGEFRRLLSDNKPGAASEAQALLQSMLAKMNLVSREEFDAQTAVLARTRAKLEALEAQLATLEAQHKQQ